MARINSKFEALNTKGKKGRCEGTGCMSTGLSFKEHSKASVANAWMMMMMMMIGWIMRILKGLKNDTIGDTLRITTLTDRMVPFFFFV